MSGSKGRKSRSPRKRKIPSHNVTGKLSKTGRMKTKTVYDITRPTVNVNIYSYNSSAPFNRVDDCGKIA